MKLTTYTISAQNCHPPHAKRTTALPPSREDNSPNCWCDNHFDPAYNTGLWLRNMKPTTYLARRYYWKNIAKYAINAHNWLWSPHQMNYCFDPEGDNFYPEKTTTQIAGVIQHATQEFGPRTCRQHTCNKRRSVSVIVIPLPKWETNGSLVRALANVQLPRSPDVMQVWWMTYVSRYADRWWYF